MPWKYKWPVGYSMVFDEIQVISGYSMVYYENTTDIEDITWPSIWILSSSVQLDISRVSAANEWDIDKWQVGYSVVYYENTSDKWNIPW